MISVFLSEKKLIKKRILIVDNKKLNVAIVKTRMEARHYKVIVIPSGPEAFERMKKDRPDMTVLTMHGSDLKQDFASFEVCRMLREEETTKNIPIVMLLGISGKGLEKECFDAGATALVYLPDLGELFDSIDKVFGGRRLFSHFPVAEPNYQNGVVKLSYPNGALKTELHCANGKLDQICKEYYPAGELKVEWHFKKGRLHGLTREYYKDGTVKEEVNFLNHRRSGPSRGFYPSGTVKWRDCYDNGVLTQTEEYASSGKIKFTEGY